MYRVPIWNRNVFMEYKIAKCLYIILDKPLNKQYYYKLKHDLNVYKINTISL